MPEWPLPLVGIGVREGRSLGRFSDTAESGSKSAGTGQSVQSCPVLPERFSSAGGGDRTAEEVDCFVLAFDNAEW